MAGQQLSYGSGGKRGDLVTARVQVVGKSSATRKVSLQCDCTVSGGVLLCGVVEWNAPTADSPSSDAASLDTARCAGGTSLRNLIEDARRTAPIRTAVVHPCDGISMWGALEGMRAGLIVPIFVGPLSKMRRVAVESNCDISQVKMIDVPHSHAAAEHVVQMARQGMVDALMKGSLHTNELMAAVVDREKGLCTDRRISHVFVIRIPHYHKPLLLTDAAININPDLEVKRDIVRNAIDFAHVLGIMNPKVALLAAVETVSAKMPSTVDAAALCKMAERGQITGGLLDGPLAFDNAVSTAAARTKGISSRVSGDADILVVPDLEAGNLLAKQLVYFAEADIAGLVLGARLPIVLTSRADDVAARLASCALAKLMVRRGAPGKST